MRFLVVGASGFVGQHLISELITRSYDCIGVARAFPKLPSCRYYEISDFSIYDNWNSLLKNVDVVIYLAARVHIMRENSKNPLQEFLNVNLAIVEKIAIAASGAGVKRFVYTSTAKVNGEKTAEHVFVESDKPNPEDPYSNSKLQSEEMLRNLSVRTNLKVIILRPPLVYGPGVKANFLTLMRVVNKGIPLPLGRINNKRSMIYVGNLVDALICCATNPKAENQTFFVSDGNDLSVADLSLKISEHMKKKCLIFPFPLKVIRFFGFVFNKSKVVNRMTDSLELDISFIKSRIGWAPPFTVNESISRTVNWFLSSNANTQDL